MLLFCVEKLVVLCGGCGCVSVVSTTAATSQRCARMKSDRIVPGDHFHTLPWGRAGSLSNTARGLPIYVSQAVLAWGF